MLYPLLFRHLLSRLDAERAHHLAAATLGVLGRRPRSRAALRRALGTPDPVLTTHALGLTFPSPLGVAAGVDKDATWFEGLGAIGFGFVEIGTVTALGQPGNAKPRVTRLTEDRALLNSMGFPNAGATAVEPRLRARSGATVVGLNVGKSKAAERATEDYRATVRRLAPHADYLVLNVSSPNTPGLRDLQAVDVLGDLIAGVRAELASIDLSRPLLVKIAPDLADEQIDAIADLALERGLDGLIATNTTIGREGLVAPLDPSLPGGISGAPLKARALQVLRRLHARVGDRLVLVAVGGIETEADAWERILAGATLVQAYTGFVYGGPLWPREVNRGLARRTRQTGAASIQALVGTAA